MAGCVAEVGAQVAVCTRNEGFVVGRESPFHVSVAAVVNDLTPVIEPGWRPGTWTPRSSAATA